LKDCKDRLQSNKKVVKELRLHGACKKTKTGTGPAQKGGGGPGSLRGKGGGEGDSGRPNWVRRGKVPGLD